MPETEARSPIGRFASAVSNVIDGPITWFRGEYFRLRISLRNNLRALLVRDVRVT